MAYNLLSRQAARRLFGGEVVAVTEGSHNYHKFLSFFQTNREKEPMGIVEIEL
jgi:hypothetical protein